jgi:pterin-4a-carbinolamine dehydratase
MTDLLHRACQALEGGAPMSASDPHPALAVSYDRCVVRFRTHAVGGIPANDFICAAKVNAPVAFVG